MVPKVEYLPSMPLKSSRFNIQDKTKPKPVDFNGMIGRYSTFISKHGGAFSQELYCCTNYVITEISDQIGNYMGEKHEWPHRTSFRSAIERTSVGRFATGGPTALHKAYAGDMRYSNKGTIMLIYI